MSLTKTLDGILREAVGENHVPGVIGVVADRNGPVYQGAFGHRARGGDAEMTLDTVVWIASMTKAVTGAGVMRLVEEGELDLDEPASRWLPMLDELDVLEGFDDHGRPRLRRPKTQITTRHLLTHTAGFSYEFWNEDIKRYQETTGLPPIISCTLDSLRMPLGFDPGSRWDYGIGIDIVGRIAEEITGKKIGAYLDDVLFTPLGMSDTSFRLREDQLSRLAKMHMRDADGNLAPFDLVIEQDPEFEMGGGGLYSTAVDYLKFTRMILGGGQLDGTRILREETVGQMCSNQMGELRTVPLISAIPQMTNDCDFFPGVPMGWGLTFQVSMADCPTGRSSGSSSWAGLCNSYYWIDHTAGLTGVYISQILPFMDRYSYPAFERFESAVYEGFKR